MKGKLPSLDPPTRFYFLAGSPCYLLFFFSQASSLFIWVHVILIDIHRGLCLCTSFLVRIAGGGAAPSPLHPPTRFYFNRFPLLPTILFVFHKRRLFGFIFYLYWYPLRFVPMYFFLGTHCGGRRCALPPATPHPLLFLNWLPLLPTLFHFFHRYRFFGFIFSFLILIYIHRDLSLCASFLVRIGEGLHPPTRFYFLIDFPCYLLSFFFFHMYRFFGFIFSFLIFIYIHRDLSLCASFLVRIAGGGAAPSPLHPPTRFYFLIDFPCYLLSFFSTQWLRKALLSKLALTETKHQVCGDSLISSEDPSRSMVGEISLKYSTQLRNLNSPPGKGSKATCSIASWLSAKSAASRTSKWKPFPLTFAAYSSIFWTTSGLGSCPPKEFFGSLFVAFCGAVRSEVLEPPPSTK